MNTDNRASIADHETADGAIASSTITFAAASAAMATTVAPAATAPAAIATTTPAAAATAHVPEGGEVDVVVVFVPEAPVTSSIAKEAEPVAPPATASLAAVAPLSKEVLSLELPSVYSSDTFGAGSDKADLLEK
jgi:hypothetical protein